MDSLIFAKGHSELSKLRRWRYARRFAVIHQEAFPNNYLTQLGYAFLVIFYYSLINYSKAMVVGLKDHDNVIGFAAGIPVTKGSYLGLAIAKWWLYLPLGVLIMVTKPFSVGRIMYFAWASKLDRSDASRQRPSCLEILSVAVAPEYQGSGYGQRLIKLVCDLAANSYKRIIITTDALNNESVVRFYERNEFIQKERIESYGGRQMIVMELELAT